MKKIILVSLLIGSIGYGDSYSWPPGGNGGGTIDTGNTGGSAYYVGPNEIGSSAAGTVGQCLKSGGTGSPTWGACGVGAAITSLNAQTGSIQVFANDTNNIITSSNNTHTLGWSGTLSLSRGGTANALTAVNGGVAYSDSSKLNLLAAGTSGQFLKSTGAGAPVWDIPTDTGITSLNAQTGLTQVFANDTNLVITSSNNTHSLGWASTLGVSRGGTGAALSPALGNIVYTDASKLALLAAGTSGQFLQSNGAGAPSWASPTDTGITSLNSQTGTTQAFSNDTNVVITSSNNTHTLGWSGTLALSRGGSGASLTAANGGVVYSDASKMQILAAGTSGQLLTSSGAGAPAWGLVSLTSQVSGTLPIANGGTNNASLGPVLGGVIYSDATKLNTLAAGTSGQVLVSNGAAAPSWASASSIGISSLNGQTGNTQVFANDTNNIITSSNNTHTLGWAGTLAMNRGGSGAALTAANGGMIYSSASAMVVLAAGTANQILQSNGAAAPSWIAAPVESLNGQTGATQVFANDTNVVVTSSNNTHTLGWASTLSLSRGGTAAALTAANGGIVYSDASKMQILAAGTSGQILTSGGAGAPTWTGVLPIANGGTANSSLSYATLTDGATVTWALAGIINNAKVTLGGNRTLDFTGLVAGMSGTLVVIQDGTGSRTLGVPTGDCTNKVISGGAGVITLSTAANAIDVLTFSYDGTNCYWAYGNNYN